MGFNTIKADTNVFKHNLKKDKIKSNVNRYKLTNTTNMSAAKAIIKGKFIVLNILFSLGR